MPTLPLPDGLMLFYDLVHRLNSTLDLEVVLRQVIEQVNQFLNIDATSVSLLDAESQELVIQMTVGQASDPQPGLRLPPYAGIAGWVVRHAEPLLVVDAQQDQRFYPSVDQRTGFSTRALICVPLLSKDQPIGVVQAMSRSPKAFSRADLAFMVTLADVASMAIANARLYRAEQGARSQAEALKRTAETISSSLSVEQVVMQALEQLARVLPCDSTTVYVLEQPERGQGDERQRGKEYLRVLAAHGLGDEQPIVGTVVPAEDVLLFSHLRTTMLPIAMSDVRAQSTYPHRSGVEAIGSWLGVPMISQGEVIGQVSIARHQMSEFTTAEIEIGMAFAHQIAAAVSRALLYRDACARADELAVRDEVASAASTSLDPAVYLARALDSVLGLLGLSSGGVALWDEAGWRLNWQVRRGHLPQVVDRLLDLSSQEGRALRSTISAHETTVLELPTPGTREAPEGDGKGETAVVALVPVPTQRMPPGILVLCSRERRQFQGSQLSLLEAIGRQLGIALDRGIDGPA